MKDKLLEIEEKYNELNKMMSDPEAFADSKKYGSLARAHAQLQPLAQKIDELRDVEASAKDAETMKNEAGDNAELRDYFDKEIRELTARQESLLEELKGLIITGDPADEKDVIMEIRAGAGGNEAALFTADLYRMYSRFAEDQGWKAETINSSPSDLGGFKEVVFSIQGRGAYSRLKYESGVHRVQRIPVTESGGRIHTSTSTVAVLPDVEDVEVEINSNDLRIDIFRSSGPGGQSVNTTDSAVRITHMPTGLVVQCQDQKSQLQNKEQAMRILRARLYEKLVTEQQAEVAEARRLQIGTGDRSERIRTYNYPQGRVTDHRIGFTLYKLDMVMEGQINEVIDALMAADKAEKLKKVV